MAHLKTKFLCVSRKKCIRVIDGEPKFAGFIQVKKIVKEVGTILG